MVEGNKIRDAADALKGLAEAVPIYQDALQPAAKEVGTALQTVAKTIHIVLAPVSVLVWGYEQIQDFVSTKLAEKLKNVPPENIATPKPNIAGPALESLRYTGHEETLREMYANLLAASMDTRTANGTHPSFVEIIRQLTPDEARILNLLIQDRLFPLLNIRAERKSRRGGAQDVLINFSLLGWEANCDYPNQAPTYISNLCRLGLVEVPNFQEYADPGIYEQLEKHPFIEAEKKSYELANEDCRIVFKRKMLTITELGKNFLMVCVISHDQKNLT